MPLAVDTNVLARALVDDGSEQARRSRMLLSEKEIFVPDSVLLETEWLLRSIMKLDRSHINRTFATLLASANISFSDRRGLADVITSHGAGLDFADAMHLHASEGCDGLASFDIDFKRRAKKIAGAIPVVTP
ncbi:type II toxin-antitoxin system VapC family toxin [Kumtagia ephedrae]|nr:type II toxin-antitoxin system VapC family toxin [Mesorhizobium ephedrae]